MGNAFSPGAEMSGTVPVDGNGSTNGDSPAHPTAGQTIATGAGPYPPGQSLALRSYYYVLRISIPQYRQSRYNNGMVTDADFHFLPFAPQSDGELEVVLIGCIPPDPATNRAPVYDCQMRVDGVAIGNINLRIGQQESLVLYGGHIGYGVFPSFQGHHYAERACRLLLPLAKAHGMTELWITCNPENMPSRRTCERLGARLVEIITLPADCDRYAAGDRYKCRYRLEIA